MVKIGPVVLEKNQETTDDDRRQPIATGHQSVSGDLNMSYGKYFFNISSAFCEILILNSFYDIIRSTAPYVTIECKESQHDFLQGLYTVTNEVCFPYGFIQLFAKKHFLLKYLCVVWFYFEWNSFLIQNETGTVPRCLA